jgi:zinc D-Ala-D-Ala carboxypeptidase
MKLSANFQLSELVKSQVAERKGIPNNPSPAHIDNLKALCVNVLQPIRSHFDSPVNLEFDQLILEFYRDGEPDSGWIHVSWNSDHNRNQTLKAIKNEDGKTVYQPW